MCDRTHERTSTCRKREPALMIVDRVEGDMERCDSRDVKSAATAAAVALTDLRSVCKYLYVYVWCIYICVHVMYVYMYGYVYDSREFICAAYAAVISYVCMYTLTLCTPYIYIGMCTYISIHFYVCTHKHICICKYLYMCIHRTYTYIYIYIYTHIHIYIHMCVYE